MRWRDWFGYRRGHRLGLFILALIAFNALIAAFAIPRPEAWIVARYGTIALTMLFLLIHAGSHAGNHPEMNAKYRKWLLAAPWTSRQPLPFGSVVLTPIDLVILGTLTAFCVFIEPKLPWAVPLVAYLNAYCVTAAFCFFIFDKRNFSRVIHAGVLAQALLLPNWTAMLLVAALIYPVAAMGMSDSLAEMKRLQPGRRQKQVVDVPWYFDRLGPKPTTPEFPFSWPMALAISLGAVLWLTAAYQAVEPLLKKTPEFGILFALPGLSIFLIVMVSRIELYARIGQSALPIGVRFRERIFYFDVFDRIILETAALLVFVGAMIAGCVIYDGSPLVTAQITLFVCLLVMFGTGPQVGLLNLTGPISIMPRQREGENREKTGVASSISDTQFFRFFRNSVRIDSHDPRKAIHPLLIYPLRFWRWISAVLPHWPFLVIFAALYCLIPYLLQDDKYRGDLNSHFGALRSLVFYAGIIVLGAARHRSNNLAQDPKVINWLQQAGWDGRLPFPLGPVGLQIQDIAVVFIAWLFSFLHLQYHLATETSPNPGQIVTLAAVSCVAPVLYLLGYMLVLIINVKYTAVSANWRLALVATGLTVFLFIGHWQAILMVFFATIAVTLAIDHRVLRTIGREFKIENYFDQYMESLPKESSPAKNQSLLVLLAPRANEPVDFRKLAINSALTGWIIFCLVTPIYLVVTYRNNPEHLLIFKLALLGYYAALVFIWVCFRIDTCHRPCVPPLSMLARLLQFQIYLPGYSYLAVCQMGLGLCLWIIPVVFDQAGFTVPACAGISVAIAVFLLRGPWPSRRKWMLTGRFSFKSFVNAKAEEESAI